MSLSPPKKSGILRQSNQASAVKSNSNTPNRTTAYTNVKDIPLDPSAQYTISYVPGMSEHEIETGNTFEEARMRVVLLTCELERVNTYNYTLVKENEVLRVQTDKSARERDLETKLAIVLAENEKLNQVIEEVYEIYMSQRDYDQEGQEGGSNEEYERRIAELYQSLDEWRQKCDVLESQTNIVDLQNAVKELQGQKDLLTEQLNRKDRDLEAIRARLAGLESGSTPKSGDSDQKVIILTSENEALKKELEAMKLKYGKADGLQLKLAEYDNKVRTILAENEKLNDMLVTKVEEVRQLREKSGTQTPKSATKIVEVVYSTPAKSDEQKKRAALPATTGNKEKEVDSRVPALVKENDDLKTQVSGLNAENRKLSASLAEKEKDIIILQGSVGNNSETKTAIEKLSLKIKELIQENDGLKTLLQDKNKENTGLYGRIRELEKATQDQVNSLKKSLSAEEREKLKETIEQKNKEMDDLYSRFSALHAQAMLADEYKDKVILISQENERLNNLLQAKIEEVDDLKKKLALANAGPAIPSSEYESKISVLLAENQRLTGQVKEQAKEIDTLRLKVYDLEYKAAQISELQSKISLLSSENERLNSELTTLRIKSYDNRTPELQSQVNYLITEKNKLEAALQEKSRELADLKDNHVRAMENNVNELSKQNENLKSSGTDQKKKIGELEGRLSQLVSLETKVNLFNIEIEKLHRDVIERENHIQSIGRKLEEKERELEEAKRKNTLLENQKQYELEDLKNKLLAEQERKIATVRDELEARIRKLNAEKQDLEDKERYIALEMERLQNLIQSIKGELEDWKRRYIQLETSRNNDGREVDELRRQFEALKQMNLQTKDMQQKFEAERTAYETQLLQLHQTVGDLEQHIEVLTAENERLLSLSVQRLSIIEELKMNNNEDSHKLEVYELKNQVEYLKSNAFDVKQLAVQYSADRAADQSKINELKEMNANYRAEVEKLRDLLDQRRVDVESLAQQNEDLRRICEKLNKQSQGSLRTSGSLETVEKLKAKVTELEISRNDFQRQAERNSIELTRKNKDLVEKIQELDVLKLKYEEALANYQALNTQLFQRLSVGQH